MAAISTQMNWAKLHALLEPLGLRPVGAVRPDDAAPSPVIVPIAPDEPKFWQVFRNSPEFGDGKDHPMDRWSERVISDLARKIGASAYFPFSGPPYYPFFDWALGTGRVHQSPIKLAVDHHAGLFVAFRGAIGLTTDIDAPEATDHPCHNCDAPCAKSCPIGAFDTGIYAAAACTDHITSYAGNKCWQGGCLARRSCPLTHKTQRSAEHAQFHLSAFAKR